MTRIAVIGTGGSGKSTLARALGDALAIPVFHLDWIFWRPGGEQIDHEEFAGRQREICATPRWILDGDYSRTIDLRLQAADTIVFLDVSTATCLYRVARRYVLERMSSRDDRVDGPREPFTVEFWHYLRCWLGIVWFRGRRRRDILQALGRWKDEKDVYILSSISAADAFLAHAARRAPTTLTPRRRRSDDRTTPRRAMLLD